MNPFAIIASFNYFIKIILFKKRQKVISFYQSGVRQQKWLQMGFEPMPAPIRDGIWSEVAEVLKQKSFLKAHFGIENKSNIKFILPTEIFLNNWDKILWKSLNKPAPQWTRQRSVMEKILPTYNFYNVFCFFSPGETPPKIYSLAPPFHY